MKTNDFRKVMFKFFCSIGLLCYSLVYLGSCSSQKEEAPLPTVDLKTISFVAAPDLNLNAAVSVDLAVSYDQKLYDRLKQMTSEQYYTFANQLRQDYYGLLQIWRWGVVPGQTGYYQLNAPISQAIGAVLFADYQTPGEHRADIGRIVNAFIHLDRGELRLTQDDDVGENITFKEVSPVSTLAPLSTRPPTVKPASSIQTDGK